MNALNQFVTQLATFIGEPPMSTRVAWVVVAVAALFLLWLLRWLINWYFKTNQIVANQEHIIALLETHRSMAQPGRPSTSAIPVPTAPSMTQPAPIRQHPIDDEFSEILNVRPHNLGGAQRSPRPQGAGPAPAQPVRMTPNLPPPPAGISNQSPPPNFTAPNSPAIAAPSNSANADVFAPPPNEAKVAAPSAELEAKPVNTSVTMLGSPEQRAERQMEAREAMRLAEQAANATRSKTADIPDIPTALVRTYSGGKTNPLTGKRVGDNAANNADGERQDGIPSQFQLRE